MGSRAGGELTRLVERQGLTPLVLAGMLGLAFVFGSFHAIGPGHGKTVMAAYLVGTSGRTADAVLLGVIVSLMHTGSVLVLGLALLQLNRYGAIERIYPLLTVLSGLIVVGFGAVLLRRRLRSLRATNRHHDHDDHGDHRHDAEAHAHGKGHSHGDGHSHSEGHAHQGHSHQDHAPGEDHAQGGHDHGHHHGPGGHTHELPEGTKPLSLSLIHI